MSVIIGIDPGLEGAITIFDVDELSMLVYPMPTFEVTVSGKKRKKYDAHAITSLLEEFEFATVMVYLEEVWAMSGDGAVGAFAFGEGFGILKGILAARNLPYTLVRPAVWKKKLGVSADKDAARLKASALLPNLAKEWKLKKQDGLAEASLIALYGFTDMGFKITGPIQNEKG